MLRTLFAILIALFAVPFQASAASAGTFLSSTGCFEATPDYPSWLQSLDIERGGRKVPAEMLGKVVPERMFAFAKSGFDCQVVTYDSDGLVVSGYVVRRKQDGGAGPRALLVHNGGGRRRFGRAG